MAEMRIKVITALQAIQSDMENDAKRIDGHPLDGPMVGEMFGNLMAAVSVLAKIIEDHERGHPLN